MLKLFEVNSIDELAKEGLKSSEFEGWDENNTSNFHYNIVNRTVERKELPRDLLLSYDKNIFIHTKQINEHRNPPVTWKYFQYLSLLFTEIYLDRFFRNPEKLKNDLNNYLEEFNRDLPGINLPPFTEKDLNKLAFWAATGSGKTLLMHVNILQYRYYLNLHKRGDELNRTILLTPNEGLSQQHLEELNLSGMQCMMFDKNKVERDMLTAQYIEVIDIHKIREEMGEKTVAVEAFEGNNLVLVDEGHRGSSGEEWKSRRDRLCEHGFSFEYSATFGQAMKAGKKKNLEDEYAKCILFDYSYKYFYNDGYGKEFSILNLAEDKDEEYRKLYLTACLVAFYQQQRVYMEKKKEFTPYLLERPLWVFVGGTVKAVRREKGRDVSDVIDILLFLADFLKRPEKAKARIEKLLSGITELLDSKDRDIFANRFGYLVKSSEGPEAIYSSILKILFNSDSSGKLHLENLKGSNGELALKIGENSPFGLINVSDGGDLYKLCENFDDIVVQEKPFSGSLFGNINGTSSTLNVLIGSKKFTEGWNSWRVSTMGFMNIGRTEGSEIIQLFGRGVRLKGYEHCLKRTKPGWKKDVPKDIGYVETLNIFGVRADYMHQFKEYLEEEGLPTEEDREEIILPVIKNLGELKLKVIKLPDNLYFKKDGPKPELDLPSGNICKDPITLDWYPRIQARESQSSVNSANSRINEEKFTPRHIAFMNLEEIYFEIQKQKNEESWYNFNLDIGMIETLLHNRDWYKLYIPKKEMEFNSFDNVRRWQEIATALIKKYCKQYYYDRKAEWEEKHLSYQVLTKDDGNFFDEYKVLIDKSKEEIISKLKELNNKIKESKLKDVEWGTFSRIIFHQHLYRPLIYLNENEVKVSPVSLNSGEKKFVLDLRDFYEKNKTFFENKQLYLLRNMSRGRGYGFFQAGNFYPDFIMWIL